MRQYIGLIHKEGASDFGVSFPDLPGCVTAGSSLDEARAFAEEVLALHLQGLAEDREPIPAPSSLDEIMRDPANRDGGVMVVPARVSGRAVRVNITLPADVLDRIDAYVEKHKTNRSSFLLQAAKNAMGLL